MGPPAGYMDTVFDRMDLYDASEPQIRELVREYGLAAAIRTARLFYGRWELAREALEAQRKALQVQRWENTT